MGTISVGAGITMSGILLAQVEESEDDLQLSKEQGSWFGMRLNMTFRITTRTKKLLDFNPMLLVPRFYVSNIL